MTMKSMGESGRPACQRDELASAASRAPFALRVANVLTAGSRVAAPSAALKNDRIRPGLGLCRF